MKKNCFIYHAKGKGNRLVIPAEGMAPRLFLEWVRDTQRDPRGMSMTIETRYRNTDNNHLTDEWAEELQTVFVISLPFAITATFAEARDYINGNL